MRCSAVFLVVMAVLFAGSLAQAVETQPAEKQLKLRVVRSDNNQPIADALVYYHIDGGEFVKLTTDASGNDVIPVPANFRMMQLEIAKDSFVEYWIDFGNGPRADALPETYVAHLMPGTTVGGIVRDEDGKPVEGAKVHFEAFYELPDHPGRMVNGAGLATTDAKGQWTFKGAPAKPQQMLTISAQHPDFLLKSSHQNLEMVDFEKLKKQSLVTVIRRGISVPGVVLDEQGKAVAGAKVGQDSLGLVNGTTSDADGKFVLRGVEQGKRQVMVDADGFVAEATEIEVTTPDRKPIEVHLHKGQTVRGHVVDSHGRPVDHAYLTFIPYEKFPRLTAHAITDVEGRFVWTGAPAGPVSATAFKQSYLRIPKFTVVADGSDVKVVLPEVTNGDPFGRETALTVTGTAVDDQTGAPLKKFKALVTMQRDDRGTMSWSSHADGAAGKFSVPIYEAGDKYVVRIDADGYLPLESPALHGAKVTFDARLKPATPIAGVLLQPDGKPAAAADVALREWYVISLTGGRIDIRNSLTPQVHITKADSEGKFELPPREGKVRAFAVHDSGWGEWVVDGQGAIARPLTLMPWSTIEGTVVFGGKPGSGQTVRLQPMLSAGSMPTNRAEYSARSFFRYETMTDDNGHFKFDRVIDGHMELTIGGYDGLTSSLDLKAGEHRALHYGGTGRPVIGRLELPADLRGKVRMPATGRLSVVRPIFIPPAGYEALPDDQKQKLRDAFKSSPEVLAYNSQPTGYPVQVKSDGTFRADDIPAGDYTLGVMIQGTEPDANRMIPLIAAVRSNVTVPPIPGGRSDEPLDVSKFEFAPTDSSPRKPLVLQAFRDVKVGEAAPDFEALTYDGKKAKLSDLHGKWVLIDFWATWCGPCMEEIRHLERMNDKLSKESRLVVIGISLDDRQQEPARFLQNRKLPWLQWYGGAGGPQSGFETFGIHAIPSGWLISPEGKVIARDLIGDAVPTALDKALNAK